MGESFSIDDYHAIWRHKEFTVVGTQGILPKRLGKAARQLEDFKDLETTPIIPLQNRDSLGVFYCGVPSQDVTIDRYASGRTVIIVLSVAEEKSRQLTEKIIKKIGLSRRDPREGTFIEVLDKGLSFGISGYERAASLAPHFHSTIERVYGATGYMRFLKYKKIPPIEAAEITSRKFNVLVPAVY